MKRNITLNLRFVLVIAVLLPFGTSAQLVINNTINSADGVQNVLLGGGVTATNVSFQGSNEQVGGFTCNSCGLGLGNGLVIGTGNVDGSVGPNNSGSYSLGPPSGVDNVSDPDLAELSGMNLNNTAVLSFDFIPTGDSLFFNYVFGSEEYPEYVGSINDAFGFFLSGPGISGPYTNNAANIALLPASTTPISINTVNPNTNSQYYINNTGQVANVQPDGLTVVMTAFAEVTCGESYHIKIVIGDASDGSWDSWVFLEAGSFQSNLLAAQYTAPNLSAANGGMYEGCDPAEITFTRSTGIDTEQSYSLAFTGTASNGVDFELISPQLVFTGGQTTMSIPLVAIQDGVLEGTETLTITMIGDGCSTTNTTLDIFISDLPALNVLIPDVMINCGQQAVLAPTISGGLGNYLVSWDIGTINDTLSAYPDVPTSYPFVVTDTCGVIPFNGLANVVFVQNPPITVNVGADISATCLDQINVPSTVSGGFGDYQYNWVYNGVFFSVSDSISFNDNEDVALQLTVTDDCEASGSDAVNVTYPAVPVNFSLGPDFTVSCQDQTLVDPVISGGVGSYTYQWSSPLGILGAGNSYQMQTSSAINLTLLVADECGNTHSDVVGFSVPPVPVIFDLGNDFSVTCLDVTTLAPDVTGGVGSYSYEWSSQSGVLGFGSQLQFQTSDADDVSLVVTDECGNSSSDLVSFSVPQVSMNVDLGENITAQCIDQIVLDGVADGGVGDYSYTWMVNGIQESSMPTLTQQFLENATVELIAEDECGNTTSDLINVQIPPVAVTADAGDDVVTTCLESTMLQAEATGGVGVITYTWSDATGVFSSSVSPVYSSFNNQNITLTATDQCGNMDTDLISIQIPAVAVIVESMSDTTICLHEGVLLQGSASGGVGTISYSWNSNTDGSPSTFVAPEQSTQYELVATDQCGNSSSTQVVVAITDVKPGFTSEYINDNTIAFTNTSALAYSWLWEFSDGSTSVDLNPVHEFSTAQDWTATLTAYAEEGCWKSINLEYQPLGDLFVPNCFTPDKDGVNEVFFVIGHDIKKFEITIFDKWGDVVYTSDDITRPWDGSSRNGDYFVPDGVYPYRISAIGERDNFIEKSGSIIILR